LTRHDSADLHTPDLLKAWALDEGFDRAGLATLAPGTTTDQGAFFLRWLERGDHAGMEYLERRLECRLDPAKLLPGARSVLCVALQYHPLESEDPQGDLWPGVARYARGEDYHRLMERRLASLAARIRHRFPGCATRPYVDTGPLLERELAARAGLGATGKNANLLHPDAGSWFLLGEILLTLDLVSDRPLADLCGTCTRCLEACPTGALAEPYHLDSNRCISYWTIEHRGVLPDRVRAWIGDWVFGCDLCQEVCPVNAAPTPSSHRELALPPERAELDLVTLLNLEREAYVAHFRHSPMKRARLEGLQRNAAVVMGNRRDRAYVQALGKALKNGTEIVRRHAAWALGRIGGEDAIGHLEAALSREPEGSLADEIRSALPEARPDL
jgi:epoxyqueuosine reductase